MSYFLTSPRAPLPTLSIANIFLQYISQIFQERRPLETVGVSVLAKLVETVGLATFLVYWGTRTNPFE